MRSCSLLSIFRLYPLDHGSASALFLKLFSTAEVFIGASSSEQLSAAIHVRSVTQVQREDTERGVLYVADDPIVPHPIPP